MPINKGVLFLKKYSILIVVLLLLASAVSIFAIAAKNYVIVGTTDKFTSLDPAKAYEYLSDNLLQNVMTGLVKYIPGTTKIVPSLAKNWEISSDGITYTFHLKKGLKFSNGDPINAQVFKFSIDRAISLKQNPSFLLADVVKDVKVINDTTFEIRLQYPFAPFINILAFPIAYPVDPKVYSANSVYNGLPVASGPYMVTKFVRGQEMELRRNPNYYGEPAKTPIILIKIYRAANNLYMALLNGEIDVAYRTFLPQQFKMIQKNKNFKAYAGKSPFIREVVFNVKIKPFDNPKVREALSYAVNRAKISSEVFSSLVSPLYTLVPDGMWGHESVMPKYDPSKTVSILKSLGYSKDNPLKITLWYTPSHYGSTEASLALTLKNVFESTGLIKCNIKYAEWATYVDYFTKGVMGMFLLGWYPDYFDPDDYMWPFLESKASPAMGSFYSNKTVDKLLLDARIVSDIPGRTALYDAVQKIMANEAPYIPLFQGQQQVATKPNIGGILLGPVQIFRYYLLYKK